MKTYETERTVRHWYPNPLVKNRTSNEESITSLQVPLSWQSELQTQTITSSGIRSVIWGSSVSNLHFSGFLPPLYFFHLFHLGGAGGGGGAPYTLWHTWNLKRRVPDLIALPKWIICRINGKQKHEINSFCVLHNVHGFTVENILSMLVISTPINTALYQGADKSLTWPTSRYISFDVSLVIYINNTNIPLIMIKNRIYDTQNLLSL